MPRNVIYQGDLDALLRQYRGRFVMDGECAKLPQFLTDVGHTSRWMAGPRVVELAYLNPGTVIANIKFSNGRVAYPNEHGYHTGLFVGFEHCALTVDGKVRYSKFTMIDQWRGAHPRPLDARPKLGYTPAEASNRILPCDNANEFFVVVVP